MPILIDGNAFSHRWYHRWAHMVKTFGKERSSMPDNFARNNARALIALAQSIDEAKVVAGDLSFQVTPHSQLTQWPNRVAVFFDFGDGGRTAIFPDYKKARRERVRDPLLDVFFEDAKVIYRVQPENSCVVVPDLHNPCVDELDAEADDMIASVSIALRARGVPHVIFSHDIDLMHLVHDPSPRVMQYDPRTKVLLDEAAVEARVGVAPSFVVDFKSLGGDRGDGIPGVAHIGPSRARTLLKKYGSLDAVLARGPQEEKGKKVKEFLRDGRDAALLSKKLVLHKPVGDLILPLVFPTFGIPLAGQKD